MQCDRVAQRRRFGRGELLAEPAEAVERAAARSSCGPGGSGAADDEHDLLDAGGGRFFEQRGSARRPIGQAMRFAAPVGIGRERDERAARSPRAGSAPRPATSAR